MHILLALAGIAGAAIFWIYRIRDAGQAAGDIKDMANDVRLAARRFGFRSRTNVHPTEAVDDPRLAAVGIIAAMAEMDGMITEETLRELKVLAQSVFDIDLTEAEEMVIFGRWVANQCGTRHEAVRRLSKRVMYLAGPDTLNDIEDMAIRVCEKDGQLSENALETLETVKRILR